MTEHTLVLKNPIFKLLVDEIDSIIQKISQKYNIEYEEDFMQGIQDTISLHRKKHTNTLYTINALNDLIRELNGGKLDKSFSVDWENYRNSLLLTSDSGLNKIRAIKRFTANAKIYLKEEKTTLLISFLRNIIIFFLLVWQGFQQL